MKVVRAVKIILNPLAGQQGFGRSQISCYSIYKLFITAVSLLAQADSQFYTMKQMLNIGDSWNQLTTQLNCFHGVTNLKPLEPWADSAEFPIVPEKHRPQSDLTDSSEPSLEVKSAVMKTALAMNVCSLTGIKWYPSSMRLPREPVQLIGLKWHLLVMNHARLFDGIHVIVNNPEELRFEECGPIRMVHSKVFS